MRKYYLSLGALGVLAFCLATHLEQWFAGWAGNRAQSSNLLAVALGDGRRMFANHFFLKADSYFHSGYYPTIYDNRDAFETPHVAESAGALKDENGDGDHSFLGPPRDWIDRFGRNFFPSVHTHLGEQKRAQPDGKVPGQGAEHCPHCCKSAHHQHESAEDQDPAVLAHHLHAHAREHGSESDPKLDSDGHDHDSSREHPEPGSSNHPAHSEESGDEKDQSSESSSGLEREMLPWLRVSAELDPERIETYTIGAYWLRRMGKPDEAERFLRDGLRANPASPQILFDLGAIQLKTRKDPSRARNLWEIALRRWDETEAKKEKPNSLLLLQLLGGLARLEEQAGDIPKTLPYLERLKTVSPRPDAIQKWIDGLEQQ